jgi:hypothetical protein
VRLPGDRKKSMTRKDRIDAAIERGDIAELLDIVEFGPCACGGSRDGEPLCVCKMSSKQVRDAVSYAALRRGKLVRLTTP